MENRIFLLVFSLFVLMAIELQAQDTSVVDAAGDVAQDVGGDFLGAVGENLGSYWEEREKSKPFYASNTPGVCILRRDGSSQAFPDCEDLEGMSLQACCTSKTSKDIPTSVIMQNMGTPIWMQNNENFNSAIGFFGKK